MVPGRRRARLGRRARFPHHHPGRIRVIADPGRFAIPDPLVLVGPATATRRAGTVGGSPSDGGCHLRSPRTGSGSCGRRRARPPPRAARAGNRGRDRACRRWGRSPFRRPPGARRERRVDRGRAVVGRILRVGERRTGVGRRRPERPDGPPRHPPSSPGPGTDGSGCSSPPCAWLPLSTRRPRGGSGGWPRRSPSRTGTLERRSPRVNPGGNPPRVSGQIAVRRSRGLVDDIDQVVDEARPGVGR